MLKWIFNLLKQIWLFFERYGITILAICSALVCVVTLILDGILFFRKLKENKNLSYAKLKEEIMHELSRKEEDTEDVENDDLPL